MWVHLMAIVLLSNVLKLILGLTEKRLNSGPKDFSGLPRGLKRSKRPQRIFVPRY